MSRYRYVKSYPKRPLHFPLVVSGAFILSGSVMLIWAVWPIISFSLFSAPLFLTVVTPLQAEQSIMYPVSNSQEDVETDAGGSAAVLDYANPNVWYPSKPQKKSASSVTMYTISIPKLKIESAMAIVAGDDLNTSLIHYGGTALPGTHGNTVIFGHSVLPQFFNPSDYRTIFSTLPMLETGDEVYVKFDNITYKYIVEEMIVRDPADLTGLEQIYDDSYVTLITCVPPGTYWKRLNVRARLSEI